ncbi:hypothetical protein GCM10028817_21000 [Spirosoma pomorum]
MGKLTRSFDWSRTSLGSPDSWPQSLRTTLSIVLNSNFPMFLFWGPELLCFYNDAYRPSLGNDDKHPSALGRPGAKVWPEIWSIIGPQIDQVLTGGEATWHENANGAFYRNGQLEAGFWTYSYSPVRDETGEIAGVFVTCIETTPVVLQQKLLAASERQLRMVVEESTIAMAIFRGPQHVIELANDAHLQLWGRRAEEVIGRPLFEAIPEAKGQGYEALLANVLSSAEPFYATELSAQLMRHGQLERVHFNFVYHPLRNATGQVDGILVTAIDITQQVLIRQQIEASQISLQNALEVAQLGTWSFDYPTQKLSVSTRTADWFGLETQQADVETFLAQMGDEDQTKVREQLVSMLAPNSTDVYDLVHSVINRQTDHKRIIRALGKRQYGTDGQPLRIDGTAQDITLQQELQLALENEVRKRTQELASANQEVSQFNEQLQTSISDLKRSNDNLQQFAYVASHDLQEPLRKIQSFSDLLVQQLGEQIDDSSKDYLLRITSAVERMSILIKDLLAYSRIATRQQTFGLVSLKAITDRVIAMLDWSIQQTRAQITVDELPIVQGDESQLGQLMQNLLTNALKFVQPDQAPNVHIRYTKRSLTELPSLVQPTRITSFYHQISIEDQGIGFDTKYLDRIFQVFQRLHGRNQFSGTGIGLAICQRVVENHGGAITAESQLDKGTTFHVYLPD